MSASSKKFKFLFSGVDELSPSLKNMWAGSSKAVTGLKELNTRLSETNASLKKIDAFKSTNAELLKLSNATGEAKNKVSALKAELLATEKPTLAQKEHLKNATRELKQYENATKRTEQKLKKLTDQLKLANIETKNLSEEERRLTQKKGDIKGEIGKTEAWQARKAGRIGLFGTAAGAAVAGWGLARGLTKPVRASMGFEEAMSLIEARGMADVGSREERKRRIAPIRSQALKLGVKSSYSFEEIAGAQAELASAGLRVQDILQSTPSVLRAGKAGGIGLSEAADLMTGLVTMYDLEKSSSNFEMLGNVLSKTASDTKTDFSEMAEVFKYTGTQSNLLGMSVQSTASMVSAMAASNIKGSEAGTGLRATLSRLAAPTKDARDELKKLGVKTKDASGNFRDITEIIYDYARATGKLSNTKQMELAKTIAGEEAATSLLSLSKESLKTQNVLIDGIERHVNGLKALELGYFSASGYMERVASIMDDNTASAVTKLGNATSLLSMKFGDVLKPAVEKSAVGLYKFALLADEFTEKFPKISEAVGTGTLVIGGLAAGLGAMALTAKMLLPGIALAFKGLGIAATLALTPVGATIMGITGLIGVAYAKFEGFRDLVNSAGSWAFEKMGLTDQEPYMPLSMVQNPNWFSLNPSPAPSFSLEAPITINVAGPADPNAIAEAVKKAQEDLLAEQIRKINGRHFD